MKIEVRADGMHIAGYVNVPGRISSRPVQTEKGKVMEVIEQRAFANAISRAGNINMLLDHIPNRVLAKTSDGTMTLHEDNVGLRAEAVITDKEVIENTDKLKGWSFQMRNVKDTLEERASGLPLRHVTDFDMPEVSLILNKNPVYASTSLELRSDDGYSEYRAECIPFDAKKMQENNSPDYTEYEHRISEARITGK